MSGSSLLASGLLVCLILAAPSTSFAAGDKLAARTGVVAVPRNFPNHSAADIQAMFQDASALGTFAVILTDWKDENRLLVTRTLMGIAAQHDLTPVIKLNPLKAKDLEGAKLDPPSSAGGRASFSDPAFAAAFTKAALEIAELQPPYLSVATDVNLLALSDPAEYQAFAAVYATLYPKLKQTSPKTKVFVTFQWDAMQGAPAGADRKLIDAFRPRLDVVAFDSDPRKLFEKQGPTGVPADYYTRIADLSGGAELYVESSWPSEGGSGEADQVTFIRRLPALLNPLRPSMVAWSFLHDVRILIFKLRTGLIEATGTKKPAFAAFQEISAGRATSKAVAAAPAAAGAVLDRAPRSKVAVASREPAQFAIFTAKTDGTDVQIVLSDPTHELTHGRLSPDGRRVTLTRYNNRGKDGFATEEGGGYDNTEIMVVNLDGTGLETIVPPKLGVIASNSCWSPDGKSLIYISTDNPSRAPEIRQIDLATREITRVPTPSGMKVSDPHWEGRQITFPVKGDVDAIWVMNQDGSQARQISKPPKRRHDRPDEGDFDPKLSPDGKRVAFMRTFDKVDWHVIVADVDAGNEKDLTPAGTIDALPTWSNDGRRLVFWHIDPKNLPETGLWTMTPDGRDRKQIPLPRGRMYNHATFFPGDDSRIIFSGKIMKGL